MWGRLTITLYVLVLFSLINYSSCWNAHRIRNWQRVHGHRRPVRMYSPERPSNVVVFLAKMPEEKGEGADEPPEYAKWPVANIVKTCASRSLHWEGCDEHLNNNVAAMVTWAGRVPRMATGKVSTSSVRTPYDNDIAINSVLVMKVDEPLSDITQSATSDGQTNTERSEESNIEVPEVTQIDNMARKQTSEVNIDDKTMQNSDREVITEARPNNGTRKLTGITNAINNLVHLGGDDNSKLLETSAEFLKSDNQVNKVLTGSDKSDENVEARLKQPTFETGESVTKPQANGQNLVVDIDEKTADKQPKQDTAVDHVDQKELSPPEPVKVPAILPNSEVISLKDNLQAKQNSTSQLSSPHPQMATQLNTENNQIYLAAIANSTKNTSSASQNLTQPKRLKRTAEFEHDLYNSIQHPDDVPTPNNGDYFSAHDIFNIFGQLPMFAWPWSLPERSEGVSTRDRMTLAPLVKDALRRLKAQQHGDDGGFLLVASGGELWRGGMQSAEARELSDAVAEVREDGRTLVVVTAQCPRRPCKSVPVFAVGPGSELLDEVVLHLWDVPRAVVRAVTGVPRPRIRRRHVVFW